MILTICHGSWVIGFSIAGILIHYGMASMEQIEMFLGWTALVNIGLLVLSSVMIICFRKEVAYLHRLMFDLSESELSRAYFNYLAYFKLLVIIFNLVPYLVIRFLM